MPLLSLALLNQHNDDYAVRVRLLRLWRTMRPDGITIQQFHMLFVDNQGTEIEGLIDTDEIPLFDPFLLNEGKIYRITNFHVRPYEDYNRVSPATLRICLHQESFVEELPNGHDIPAYNFRFLDASDLPNAVHNHAYMSDIIGVLVLADPEEALFEDIALLRRKSVLLRMMGLENANLAIDYTFDDALWVSTPCSIPELNLYKNDLNNQVGRLYICGGQVQNVDVFWSAEKLKYIVRMIVGNGVDEVRFIFTTGKFRWIASRIIEESEKEWSNNFTNLIAYLRGNSFKFMVEVGDFNPATNDFDLVLRKLFK
ncbi:unnamed protein product [Linum trigynum]|uniref:Replication protein A 70 kDa DNA-binding subunit B/D first OB fold domain-containing protein n=1 Tax=Linum trigynum TaxID=586398 RepID=A0AAV2C9K6_9ROSI